MSGANDGRIRSPRKTGTTGRSGKRPTTIDTRRLAGGDLQAYSKRLKALESMVDASGVHGAMLAKVGELVAGRQVRAVYLSRTLAYVVNR